MKNRKPYFRFLTALLCLLLLVTLVACDDKDDPSADPADDSGDGTSVVAKNHTEKFLDALRAYDTYFNDISDAFGTKLPAASDRGTAEFRMTIPTFSVFGEERTDVFDPDKPILQATILQNGDLASLALSALLYGEQMRIEVYESATEGYLVFPDLKGQAPIRLTAEEAEDSVTDAEAAFRKQLDALGDADETAASYLVVKEDGDTCTYTLRLTEKQVGELVTDLGINFEGSASSSEQNYMLYDLTTVGGLPTELRVRLYNEGETKAGSEFLLKTSVSGSNTKINAEVSSYGETLLTFNAAVTAIQGSIILNVTLEMGEIKLTSSIKLLSESESSILLNGNAEMQIATEGSAAVSLPMDVTGKISAAGGARDMELDLRSSSTGIFDFTLRCESHFTPGEPSITLPKDAVDADQVDAEALTEALLEAYPNIMDALLNDDSDENPKQDGDEYEYQDYMSEDTDVYVAIYEDDTIYINTYMAEYVDDGESMTFYYNGKSLGTYAYKMLIEDVLESCGMMMRVTEYEDGGRNFYYTNEEDEVWIEIELFDGLAAFDLCLPFETVDGVTKILLPDGTALPFDVLLPEDDTSAMQLGSMLLLPYESMGVL